MTDIAPIARRLDRIADALESLTAAYERANPTFSVTFTEETLTAEPESTLADTIVDAIAERMKFDDNVDADSEPWGDVEGSRFPGDSRAGTFAGSPTHEPDDDDPTRFGSFGDDPDPSVVTESPDDDLPEDFDEGWLAAICPHGMVTGGGGYRTFDERLKIGEMLEGTGRHIVEYPVGPTIQLCPRCFTYRDVGEGL